ncbi:hypothetical protein AB6A40_003448 [Gnathostoma spinigerum]|uniref:EIPR1-like beta-propeller domain-containing protein n=1 Tax=Gnathostoma spinigerum TaxID=75299 RepID=A0ABD6E9K6_9BILA
MHFNDVENSLKVINSMKTECKGNINTVSWNPHSNGSTVAVASDSSVKIIDSRSYSITTVIENAHFPTVRNLDFNPSMQYILATCGDDCRVALWDLRKVQHPLKTLRDHSHWVWSVRFNPIHDQLLLSVGSDARLFLNCIASLSSETLQDVDLVDGVEPMHPRLGDERLEKVEEYEESIYTCAWAGKTREFLLRCLPMDCSPYPE